VLFVVLAAARRSATRDRVDEVSARLAEDVAWTRERVEEIEGQIETLERGDPDTGNRLRQKLHERLAAWASRLLSEPVLESHHHEQVKLAVSLLETRDPSRAKALQAAYEERGRRQDVGGGRRTGQEAVAGIPQGTLKHTQVLLLGSTWKGVTNVFGWEGVRRTLAPSLRGPIAYIFGQRYLREKRSGARMFFQTARDDAPANSPLRRLAEDRLKELKDK
jgi:hypothetical protein